MKFTTYSPLKVLLIEDSVGDAILAKEALFNSAINNNVTIAHDGQMAMDMLNCRDGYESFKKPDAILLDLDLPKKSGMQVLREIKLNQNLKNIPVMVYSKSGVSQDIHEAYCLRVDNYIIKPADSGQIFDNQQAKTQELIDGMLESVILDKTLDDVQEMDCGNILQYILQKITENTIYKGAKVSNDSMPTIKQNPIRLMVLFYNMVKVSLDFHISNFLSSKIHISYNKTDSEWVFSIKNIENELLSKKSFIEPFHKLFNKNNHGIENMHMFLCKKIIHDINGRFWVEESAKGSVILNFSIPISLKTEGSSSGIQDYYNNHLQI